MANATAPSLLWVDDQISGLSSWVAILEEAGFTVYQANATDGAIAIAAKTPLDICLVDLNMPEPDGIECLVQLFALQPKCRLAALSTYHYLDSYKSRLRALPFPVEILDKDHPSAFDERHVKLFLDSIKQLQTEGVRNTILAFEKLVEDGEIGDPFGITLDEFDRLPLALKDQYRLKAYKKASASIKKAFASGSIWVLLCGDKHTMISQANVPEAIHSEKDIREYAVSQGKPVYQFFSRLTVEDLWSHCGHSVGARFYPTVTLEFKSNAICVHFDTGAPMTLFSYEELLRLEATTPTTEFGLAIRSGDEDPYWATKLDVEVELRDQATGSTETVRIRGQIVRDWSSTSYAIFCDKSCAASENKGVSGRLCPNRSALVGRNLLIENALVMTLDGSGRRTSVRKSNPQTLNHTKQ